MIENIDATGGFTTLWKDYPPLTSFGTNIKSMSSKVMMVLISKVISKVAQRAHMITTKQNFNFTKICTP